MGTFIYELGKLTIPEEKKSAFLADAQRVIDQGGLFEYSLVHAMGMELTLLRPPSVEVIEGWDGQYRVVDFTRSYFEPHGWENAGIKPDKCTLYSNKVGYRQFNQVVQALYLLAETYSQTPYVTYNDSPNTPADTIRWLRHVLDRDVQYTWRRDLWTSIELYLKDLEEHKYGTEGLTEEIARCGKFNSDVFFRSGLSSWYYVVKGVIGLALSDKEQKVPYLEEARALLVAVFWYKVEQDEQDRDEEEQVQALLHLLVCEPEERERLLSGDGGPYGKYWKAFRTGFFETTPQIVVEAISEVYERDFWELWLQVRGRITLQTPEEECEIGTERMSTEEFLRVSADDRLYWWREDGDVAISDETWGRLDDLARIHRANCLMAEKEPDVTAWQRRFMGLLAQNKGYMIFFEEPYFEFMGSFHRPEVRAAVELLEQMTKYKPIYRMLAAIYANRHLRKKVFGF